MLQIIKTLLVSLIMIVYLQEDDRTLKVMVFGDSITAGYGIEKSSAFPAMLDSIATSQGYNVDIINAGLSGETSAGGLRRIDWMLQRPIDIFMLELGGNDGLRGIDLSSTRENLNGILSRVRARYPDVVIIIAGMEVPPNLGLDYTQDFSKIYTEISQSYDAILIPFLLEKVAGYPDLNLPDGIHPMPEGHKLVAETAWPYLKKALELVNR